MAKKAFVPQYAHKHVDEILDAVIASEQEQYHNPLVPFTQYEKNIKLLGEEFTQELFERIERAKNILKDGFRKEKHISWQLYSDAEEKLKEKSDVDLSQKTLQEHMDLSWDFMDKVYAIGKNLLSEKHFEDAAAVFELLCYLNPNVFDYWLGFAASLHELHHVEDALFAYGKCLTLNPENPLIFYQIANVFYDCKENDACVRALDIAIEHAQHQHEYAHILKQAQSIKKSLQKAA